MSNPPTKIYPEYEATDTAGNPQGGVAAFVVLYPPADGSTTAQPPPGTQSNPMYVQSVGSGTGTATSSTVTLAAGTAQAGSFAVSNFPGTQAVSGAVALTGTSSVAGAVSITGTPTVAATGTVSLAGTSSIAGSVSLIGTSAVAGTVSITGTPTVSVTGTSAVSGTIAVSSVGGTVATSLTGTGTVQAPLVTYAAPATSVIGTGGVAVTPLAAGSIGHGFDIRNPPSANEPLFFNLTAVATTVAGGANFMLQPGESYHGAFGTAQALSVNAASTGHSFTAMSY